MKTISRFLLILLTLIMVISIIPMSNITASAATYSGECGDNLTWSYNTSNNTLTISGKGEMYDFYSTNRPWEDYEDRIKTVIIADSVKTIGQSAFYHFGNLTSVTIGDSVTTIGVNAFSDCTGLIGITIPDSVTTIGKWAFEYCTNLTSLTIPDSVITIGDCAFDYCRSLTDVYYNGTEEDWKKISIGTSNEELKNANIYFKECAHQYGSYVVTREATCTTEGVRTSTCSKCGEKKTEKIAKKEHQYGAYVVTKQPTCIAEGEETSTCSLCKNARKRTIPKKTTHNLDLTKERVTKEATCTTEGAKQNYCKDCKKYIDNGTIPAKGHQFDESAIKKQPTCTEEGMAIGKCNACGFESDSPVTLPATGHNYSEWVITKQPTDTTDGEQTRTCATCQFVETQILEKLSSTPDETNTESPKNEHQSGDEAEKSIFAKIFGEEISTGNKVLLVVIVVLAVVALALTIYLIFIQRRREE